jgi:hypothetical protein
MEIETEYMEGEKDRERDRERERERKREREREKERERVRAIATITSWTSELTNNFVLSNFLLGWKKGIHNWQNLHFHTNCFTF